MFAHRQSPLIGRRASVCRPTRLALACRPLSVRCQGQSEASTSGSSNISNNTSSSWPSVGAQALGAGACASSFFAFPGLLASGSGGNRHPGGGGGGDGGGGGGGFSQGPLYDLAADDKEKTEEVDESDSTEDEPVKEVAKTGDEAWKDLLTPSDQIEDVPGQRAGTNRCVEITIEGWPEVGALPKLVRASLPQFACPCTHAMSAPCMGAEGPP